MPQGLSLTHQEHAMTNHVYKSVELTGSSAVSIEDAVSTAIARASETVRNINWFEVIETRGHVSEGKVAHWQVTLKIGFTLDE
jgi:flavin-binding protein dodecin